MIKRLERSFNLSLIFVFIQCICLSVITILETDSAASIVLSIIFWVSLAFYLLSVSSSTKKRKIIEKRKFQIKTIKKNHIGIFKFFQNKEAIVADAVFFVSTAAAVISILLKSASEWLTAIILFLWFLSFNLHCLFNGKNYIYIKALLKFKKEYEKNGPKKYKNN